MFSLLALLTKNGIGQTSDEVVGAHQKSYGTSSDSIYVIADTSFVKRGVSHWLLGDHYRREWITPVKVPVVHLDTLYGGVVVTRLGGGLQTKSLRLKALKSDKEYTIRSVEKYPDKALPKEFVGTFASDFVKDQISSAHPYAPLVVAPLADKAGIYHTTPRMIFVAHSPQLKEFDAAFGGRFYLLEERADDNQEDAANFGYSKKLVNTEKMMEQVTDKPKHIVDQSSFLRARLLDVFIGDWDRHEDQWTWASFENDSTTLYRPVPRDRDQAFAKLDGVIPSIATRTYAFRRSQHFTYRIIDLKGLLWSGRNLDRRWLTALEWKDWEKEISHVQNAWTDEVISDAVKQLPDTLFAINGEGIIKKLMHRRGDLMHYARRYYKFINREVQWIGTNEKDKFLLQPVSDSVFELSLYSKKGDGWLLRQKRLFNTKTTKELRLYGLDGDDEFEVGKGEIKGTRIRMIGGGGANAYVNNGDAAKTIRVYDTAWIDDSNANGLKKRNRYDTLTHEYTYKSHVYNITVPSLLPGYNPDDGLFLGLGVLFRKQQWGKTPFGQQYFIGFNYAFKTRAYNFWYESKFKQVFGMWDLDMNLRLNQPNYTINFYGLGNNTDLSVKDKLYNRVRVKQLLASAGASRSWIDKHSLFFYADYVSSQVNNNDGRFVSINNPLLKASDFEKATWLGVSAGYDYKSFGANIFPKKGFAVKTGSRYLYSDDKKGGFLQTDGSLSFFAPLGKWVFATRVGGARVFGTPQFFQYPQLSGLTNLRGYRRSRFTGETSFYNNNEIRIPLTTLSGYILRGKLGMTVFSDNGRVWVKGEDSDRWHLGYGGGLWILPYNKAAFSINYGASREGGLLTAKMGFFF